jgi:hypothetical protein
MRPYATVAYTAYTRSVYLFQQNLCCFTSSGSGSVYATNGTSCGATSAQGLKLLVHEPLSYYKLLACMQPMARLAVLLVDEALSY